MEFLKDLSIDKVRNIAEDAFNQAKPKTDVEARVYEVLSHKNWGSSSSLMHEVARDTMDVERFHVVTRLMWEGMENQRPAAWRIVFKALTLLEFLVKNGAERCVDDARGHAHVLRAMGQFNYYEGTIDRGLGVREKSKQILEIVSDDERIREERQKARQLREKFGGKGSTASGGGGAGGGGQYAGYGNQESWNNTGGGGGGDGGYGQGGIDSSPYDNGGGFSGRYGGSGGGADSGAAQAAPTFAAMPSSKPKKTKKKKKKQPEAAPAAPAAPAPEVDLFSFDDPSPAPVAAAAPPASNDDFGAFQETPAPAPPAPAASDDFAALAASKSSQPDPFASPAAAQPQQQDAAAFNAFGNTTTIAPPPANNAAGAMPQNVANNAMGGGVASMNNAFGAMSMGQQQQPQQQQPQATMMGAPAPANNADDEFGDFTDAPSNSPQKMANPADPMAKLVSLDGLSKNQKNQSKLHDPVVINAAAQQYIQDQAHLKNNPAAMRAQQQAATNMSFGGIDGLNNNANLMAQNGPNNNLAQAPVMVSAGGGDAISSLMGPPPAGQPQGMQAQGMGGNSPNKTQQAQQGGVQQGMQGGMQQGGMQQGMNPQMMQQMNPQMMNMMGNQMGGMQQNTGGQMMGNQMGGMQGGMNPQMNMMGNQMGMQGGMQGGMNPQMMNQMGGMPQQGMMGGNTQMGGQMGGQQQWR